MRSYVVVKFNKTDRKTYTYVTDGAVEELTQFTHAVVDSPYGSLTIVDVIKFDALDESSYTGEYKDVITLFNLEHYTMKVERRTRKAALEKELRTRVAQRKLEENFAALLADDVEGMKLLAEYKAL